MSVTQLRGSVTGLRGSVTHRVSAAAVTQVLAGPPFLRGRPARESARALVLSAFAGALSLGTVFLKMVSWGMVLGNGVCEWSLGVSGNGVCEWSLGCDVSGSGASGGVVSGM